MTDQYEKSLVLWLNCTLGVLSLAVRRVETRGAWIKFKKPILAAHPVLDLGALSADQLDQLATAYDGLCNEELRPFPEMNIDTVRAQIDETIAEVVGLPDFSILRTLLAREPVVCLEPV